MRGRTPAAGCGFTSRICCGWPQADREVEKALAAGSVPPELRQLWNRLESRGVNVHLFDRGSPERGEQETPDQFLQLRMLEDGWDYNGDPGIVALLTGDGAGYSEGAGFHRTLERMHRRGWRVEILSWAPFLQPADAAVGRGKRRLRRAGRFLRKHHFYGAIAARPPPGPVARCRPPGSGAAAGGRLKPGMMPPARRAARPPFPGCGERPPRTAGKPPSRRGGPTLFPTLGLLCGNQRNP